MSKITDFSMFKKEPLIFIDINKVKYTIPGNIKVDFFIELNSFSEAVKNIENDADMIYILQDMVITILNLDTTKTVDRETLNEGFPDVEMLKVIVDELMKHVTEITANLNSPKSAPKVTPKKK